MSRDIDWDAVPVQTASTADPAAGSSPAEITFSKRTLFLGGQCRVVFSADVQTRIPLIRIKADGTNYSLINFGGACVASETVYVGVAPGAISADQSPSGYLLIGLGSPVEFPAGAKLQLSIYNLHANDDAEAFHYYYKEMPE